jgi:hypothetical protein
MTEDSRIQLATGDVATRLASRVSRRSFLARAGRVALVLSAGGSAVGILSDPAYALPCDCGGGPKSSGCGSSRQNPGDCDEFSHSVTCKELTGDNSCPNTAVRCGSWTCTCDTCQGNVKTWTDCCETGSHCDQPGDCRCVRDKDGVRRPTCCHRKFYAGGDDHCNFIRCRISDC